MTREAFRHTKNHAFDWDDEKHEWNLEERGFGFDVAALIFEGITVETEDKRKDYGETRIQAIGEVDGEILFVVYTDRGDVRRIISARLAEEHEVEEWARKVKNRRGG